MKNPLDENEKLINTICTETAGGENEMAHIWKRRFAGSYYLDQNPDIIVKSMGQHTTEIDVDDCGNRWVAYVLCEDVCERFKTKREAVEYAETYLLPLYPVEK